MVALLAIGAAMTLLAGVRMIRPNEDMLERYRPMQWDETGKNHMTDGAPAEEWTLSRWLQNWSASGRWPA